MLDITTSHLRLFINLQDLFVSSGGFLLDNEKIDEIIPGDIIQIKTTKQVIKAKNLIITAGMYGMAF